LKQLALGRLRVPLNVNLLVKKSRLSHLTLSLGLTACECVGKPYTDKNRYIVLPVSEDGIIQRSVYRRVTDRQTDRQKCHS